jgi:outer membrane protein
MSIQKNNQNQHTYFDQERDPIMSLKNILIAITTCFAFSITALQAKDDLMYVDVQRAVFEVEDGKAAKEKLEALKNSKQKALDVQQEELKKLQESLVKQSQMMTEDVKQKKEQEFAEKLNALQQSYAMMQKELGEEEMKIQQQIFEKMSVVLEEMGKEGSYGQMILRKDALLWAPPHLDITNEVIRRYNALSNKKGTPSKAPTPKTPK